jgi:hypothetical protein
MLYLAARPAWDMKFRDESRTNKMRFRVSSTRFGRGFPGGRNFHPNRPPTLRRVAMPSLSAMAVAAGFKALFKLFLGIAPIPDGLSVYVKAVPWATDLKPGRAYSDLYEVPLPAAKWQPYADPETETDPVEVKRLIVETEWWVEPATLKVAAIEDAPGFYKAMGNPSERAATTIDVPQPVTVSRRRAAFTRF